MLLYILSLAILARRVGTSPTNNAVVTRVGETRFSDISSKRERSPAEDSIPVIEIKGEGRPMSSAQIRHLEEMSNGGPLDIRVDKSWTPTECPRTAKRLDFITFHYKAFSETGKSVDQTYGRHNDGVRIQLGVGMIMPGLDKGMKGMCEKEIRKIQVPYRLSRKNKSQMWKTIPNDEHWLTFNIEMLSIEPWTAKGQFEFMDTPMGTKSDGYLTQAELVTFIEKIRKEYGKTWDNRDIDDVLAAKYYIGYFDQNKDGKVDLAEFAHIMERDLELARNAQKRGSSKEGVKGGRLRDPGVAWILDFDNDGVVSAEEMDSADHRLESQLSIPPNESPKKEEL